MMFKSLAGVLIAAGLLTASPGAAGAQDPVCLVQQEMAAQLRVQEEERAPKPNRPVSDDTAATLAAIRAMGPGVGGVSNPQAQALLGQMAALLAGEDDADSQAAAAMLRERMGGGAGSTSPRAGGAPPSAPNDALGGSKRRIDRCQNGAPGLGRAGHALLRGRRCGSGAS
jgi:hypothetical protein